MSLETVCYYERTIPHDPYHLDPPSVDETTYPPDHKPLKRYKKFVKKTRRCRNLQIRLLECLDHKSSASEKSNTSSRQLPKSERPRVFKAFANYEKYQGLVLFKVIPPTLSDPSNLFYQFEQEVVAYSRLDKTGLCEAGYVPRYYGWYEFPPSWRSDPALAHISNHPRLSELPHSDTPPRALVIEYLDNASPISPWNITTEVAHEALRRLTEIHSIGLLHRDAFPRNLMVREDGEPVWIDFGCSMHSPDFRVRSQTQAEEYGWVACILFCFLLADHARVVRGQEIWYPDLYASTSPPKAGSTDCSLPPTDESELEGLLSPEQDPTGLYEAETVQRL
ncbi:hypothetical protein SISNIDRAFT_481995 [Sistotremastrum niveocremeum HHB9708]|uniref:Aminoglycoside phosphotransferase domain-containing protein n=1 Tax=Sistotremastrum niveocremeum HHB9708 TaxID=1314777 RepID=A0A164YM81_9AGAM|nr:hypothetical protein SISNIDRAFT_481995 [Sistotremastrum niveocremeum HHB9708]